MVVLCVHDLSSCFPILICAKYFHSFSKAFECQHTMMRRHVFSFPHYEIFVRPSVLLVSFVWVCAPCHLLCVFILYLYF